MAASRRSPQIKRSSEEKAEQKRRRKLIPIKQSELEKHEIPFSPNTLYFWHSQGKYREIFVKVAGKLFIDEDKFWEMAEGE